MEMLRFLEQLHRRAHVQLVVDLAQVADRRRLVGMRVGDAPFRCLLHFRDVSDQHRVVRGHRAAALGEDPRRRQAVFLAGVGQRLHDVAGVGMQAVVDGAIAARTGTFVIDAQTAADVDVANPGAQLGQLHEIARGLAHAVGDVAHVGYLRAHVEVQQIQRLGVLGVAQRLPQVQHLPRRQAELGLVAAAVLPLARAQRGQAHANAQARLDVQRARFLQHQLQFRRLLDDDEGLQAQFAPDQRQADVFAVLVAVADDQPARPRQRQHRHQFRLAARFQAETLAVVAGQGAGHAAVLVDLDRVHRGVAAGVVPVGLGLGEGRLQLAQALAQDVRKAHQHRQLGAGRARGVHHLGQRDRHAIGALRAHHHPAGRIHVEIPIGPMRDRIGLAGLVEGPIAHRGGSAEKGGVDCNACYAWAPLQSAPT